MDVRQAEQDATIPRVVRPDLQERRPVESVDAGAQQQGSGGRGRNHAAIHRGARSEAVSRRDTGRPEGGPISAATGKAAVHTEGRGKAAAIGDTDGQGSSGADGGEDCDRADL